MRRSAARGAARAARRRHHRHPDAPTFTDEGLRAALALRESSPGLGVLLFSQYVETRFVSELLTGGAEGSDTSSGPRRGRERVPRRADPDRGRADRARPGGRQPAHGSPRSDDGLARLTPREREVLELMAQGRSNTAIAEGLFLSYGAVEKNVTAIFGKLGLPQDAGTTAGSSRSCGTCGTERRRGGVRASVISRSRWF
ncbi:LuxR C-terminal-related transcriptional regulator [Oerskovia sp. M15]